MRLTTLSRKIGKSREELISYLQSTNTPIPEGINAKISDEIVAKVLSHFELPSNESVGNSTIDNADKSEGSPSPVENKGKLYEEVVQSEEIEKVEVKPVKAKKVVKKVVKKVAKVKDEDKIEAKKEVKAKAAKKTKSTKKVKAEPEPESEIPIAQMDESLEDFLAHSDVTLIKHKKVKLEGIKIVGKIELPKPPEPKVQEEVPQLETAKISEEPKERRPQGLYGEFLNKNQKQSNKRREPNKRRVLSFTEKQERDKRRQEEQQKKEFKRLKQKKKEYYKEKVKIEAVTPVKKKIKKKSNTQDQSNQTGAKKSNNPLKKFWNWLNGGNDNF